MTLDHMNKNTEYLNLILDPIRVCARYKPKLGQGASSGIALKEFQAMYRTDHFYHWMGLDNPLMYAAHKAAGGMTSVYRQIGIGAERLFRQILVDNLGLTEEDVIWSYEVPKTGRRKVTRKLSLDARIPLDKVQDQKKKEKISQWIQTTARALGVDQRIIQSLSGIVFEVRQGYKSKDSKRQNADLTNAATAYTKTYLPCVAVLSLQIDTDIALRYTNAKWVLLKGSFGQNDPYTSVYDFLNEIIGYNLVTFFERNSTVIQHEVDLILRSLLTTDEK